MLFESLDPFGFSLRTSLLSALAEQTGFSGTWKDSGTPQRRSWWVLSTPERRTADTGSGSSRIFPTPSAQDAERGAESRSTKDARGSGGINLREACNWPTPRAEDSEQTGAHGSSADTLTSAGRSWNTHSAQDAKNATLPPSQINRDSVVGQCLQAHTSTTGKPRGSLNPAWVSQLMGYPDGWLDIDDATVSRLSETRSSRKPSS